MKPFWIQIPNHKSSLKKSQKSMNVFLFWVRVRVRVSSLSVGNQSFTVSLSHSNITQVLLCGQTKLRNVTRTSMQDYFQLHLSHLQVLLRIFSFLSHREILKYAVVCKKWHLISQDSRLWGFVSLRPEISGLRVEREDHMLQLISTKFGNNLRYL